MASPRIVTLGLYGGRIPYLELHILRLVYRLQSRDPVQHREPAPPATTSPDSQSASAPAGRGIFQKLQQLFRL